MCFNTFGDHRRAHLSGEFGNGMRETPASVVDIDVAGDRLVDLDEFRAQLEHMGEGREAGADVVDRHPDTSCAAGLQRIVERTVVQDSVMFGKLQHNSRGIDVRQHLLPRSDQRGGRGDVHRDENVLGQLGHHRDDASYDRCLQLDPPQAQQRRLRKESVRAERFTGKPSQRLYTHHLAGWYVVHRLEHHFEIALIHHPADGGALRGGGVPAVLGRIDQRADEFGDLLDDAHIEIGEVGLGLAADRAHHPDGSAVTVQHRHTDVAPARIRESRAARRWSDWRWCRGRSRAAGRR